MDPYTLNARMKHYPYIDTDGMRAGTIRLLVDYDAQAATLFVGSSDVTVGIRPTGEIAQPENIPIYAFVDDEDAPLGSFIGTNAPR